MNGRPHLIILSAGHFGEGLDHPRGILPRGKGLRAGGTVDIAQTQRTDSTGKPRRARNRQNLRIAFDEGAITGSGAPSAQSGRRRREEMAWN